MHSWHWRQLLAVGALLCAQLSFAQGDVDPIEAEYDAAKQAALAVATRGPGQVPLGRQGTLDLPEQFIYIPKSESARLLTAMGNTPGDDLIGMIYGKELSGFVTISYEASGYIKDDDAREWDADEMLDQLKEGTEAGNELRRQRGIPEFEVAGWVQAPSYEQMNHRLVWSAELRDKVPTSQEESPGVNYNTYVLGREGYLSLNLVTDLASVEAEKPLVHALLDHTSFVEGKRYADFNESTDKVAAYGLAALVGGVAAKKLGLLATLGIMLVKFWKLALIAVVGLGAAIKRIFFGKAAG